MSEVKTEVLLSKAVSAALATIMGAVELEAGVRAKAETELLEAGTTVWAKVRDAFAGIITAKPTKAKKGEEPPALPVAEARLLLAAVRTACAEAAKSNPKMGRGKQYASDLARACTAVEKDKAIPAELWTATRKEWTEAEFWKEAGVLKATGKATHKAKEKADGEEEGEEGETGKKIANIVLDPALSALMAVVAVLHGPFRSEFISEAKELADRILKKQGHAGQASDGREEARSEAA